MSMKQNSNSRFYRLSFPEKTFSPNLKIYFRILLLVAVLSKKKKKKKRLLRDQVHWLVQLVNIVFDCV